MQPKMCATIAIPLKEEELDKYFDEIENYVFLIEFDNCEYKGKKMLNYIYNSGMTCELKITQYNDNIAELLLEYIRFDRVLSIPVLNDFWAKILIAYVDPEQGEKGKDKDLKKFLKDFIAKNKETLEELTGVLCSLKLHMVKILDGQDGMLSNTEPKEIEKIGFNFITIRNGINFWAAFARMNSAKIFNYNVFTDFCYEGHRISNILMNELNPFSTLALIKMQEQQEDEKKEEPAADEQDNTDK